MNASEDAAMDRLEQLIADHVRDRTGHATDLVNVRALQQQLRFADKTDCGFISAQHFHEFLWRMNVIGATLAREGEMLFNRYDEDYAGSINCHDFALAVFGGGAVKRFTGATLSLLHKFRGAVVQCGLDFVLSFFDALSACADREGFAAQRVVVRTISTQMHSNYEIGPQELLTLLSVFDAKNSGDVNVTALVKRLKVSVSTLILAD